jgi:hypothetical protein
MTIINILSGLFLIGVPVLVAADAFESTTTESTTPKLND